MDAYAATVQATVAVIGTLNAQIETLEAQVGAYFGQHPNAEVYRSQPGLGAVLAARVLGEFGDATDRYTTVRSRKNYAATSPITRQSGKRKLVLARYAGNNRLADALHQQAFSALRASVGARAYYDALRARGVGHHAALRQLANRLVGILHGCLKTTPAMTRRPLGRSTRKQKQLRLDSQTTWDVCLVFFDESALSLTPNVRRTPPLAYSLRRHAGLSVS